jgi:hypothetical protein
MEGEHLVGVGGALEIGRVVPLWVGVRHITTPEVRPMAAHTKLNLRIDFDSREHPFHPDSADTGGQLKMEAIAFFGAVGDQNTLGLFRRDNIPIDDNTALSAYNLQPHEVLVLRQRNVGGGAS